MCQAIDIAGAATASLHGHAYGQAKLVIVAVVAAMAVCNAEVHGQFSAAEVNGFVNELLTDSVAQAPVLILVYLIFTTWTCNSVFLCQSLLHGIRA